MTSWSGGAEANMSGYDHTHPGSNLGVTRFLDLNFAKIFCLGSFPQAAYKQFIDNNCQSIIHC